MCTLIIECIENQVKICKELDIELLANIIRLHEHFVTWRCSYDMQQRLRPVWNS